MAGLSRLPDDLIVSEILPRLYPPAVVEFKCVNKHWRKKVSTFIKSHLMLQTPGLITFEQASNLLRLPDASEINLGSILNENEYVIVHNSCNGLVLCTATLFHQTRLYIVNPYIRRYTQLPTYPDDCVQTFLHYDHVLNRYMVLVWPDDHCDFVRDDIYLMVFGDQHQPVWHKLTLPNGLGLHSFLPAEINGWLYWLAIDARRKYQILAFNPQTRKFRHIDIPPAGDHNTKAHGYTLLSIKGSLYLADRCWDGKRLSHFVSRLETDFEKQSIHIYTCSEGAQPPQRWEFRFATTCSEAETMITCFQNMIDGGYQLQHTNSLVWGITEPPCVMWPLRKRKKKLTSELLMQESP